MTDYNHNGLQNHQAQTNLYFRLSCFFITLIPKANEPRVEKTQGITKSRSPFSDSPMLDADGLFVGGEGRVPPRKGEKLRAPVMGKAITRLCARSPLLLVPAPAAKKVYAQNISVLFSALIGQIPRIALSTGLGSGPEDFHRQGMVQLTIVLSANCTSSIKKEKVTP